MKITLEFNPPEDDYEYECAINGHKYRRVLQEYSNYLRGEYKYANKTTIKIETAREKLFELINEYEVNLS